MKKDKPLNGASRRRGLEFLDSVQKSHRRREDLEPARFEVGEILLPAFDTVAYAEWLVVSERRSSLEIIPLIEAFSHEDLRLNGEPRFALPEIRVRVRKSAMEGSVRVGWIPPKRALVFLAETGRRVKLVEDGDPDVLTLYQAVERDARELESRFGDSGALQEPARRTRMRMLAGCSVALSLPAAAALVFFLLPTFQDLPEADPFRDGAFLGARLVSPSQVCRPVTDVQIDKCFERWVRPEILVDDSATWFSILALREDGTLANAITTTNVSSSRGGWLKLPYISVPDDARWVWAVFSELPISPERFGAAAEADEIEDIPGVHAYHFAF